ncbi:energy-coupling factor transporter ATPase [Methanolobus zinderi]|jgi:energy-coupling factor transport system ATP-binding protein|uniref:Energy-coupling factor transporter ATPase n=1 Tax=Methanolobus zinderi TaxID=536044 RepID=A0A7D5EA51_9EURY|nr:energy-coupling factor transporter ATPase [Methanolobus zinderi]KXS44581.1 MAG: ABC transporter-like protein [Methanolobus sp. T82-4]QLC50977.1 energy-coupling factor transporter ATPase [Methanolobus zinderi]
MSIDVKNVSFSYDPGTSLERLALQNVNLSIDRGEFILIGGEIGSGKSTLIRHFNGLLRPSSGSVSVDGVEAHVKSIRKKVGILFQFPQNQLFARSVYEDVAFGPANFGEKGDELRKRVTKALKMVGVREELYEHSPFTLSGGEMRLVAIAGVLAIRPDYLVLDEPLSGLDPEHRESLLEILKSLHMQGISVIVVSHLIADLLPLADKIILMKKGKISFEGSPEEYVKSTSTPLPEITSLMKELKQKGFDVRDDIFDVEEALNEIIRVKKERSGSMQ